MFNSDFSELPTIYYAELFDHPGTQLNATQRTDSLLRTLTAGTASSANTLAFVQTQPAIM